MDILTPLLRQRALPAGGAVLMFLTLNRGFLPSVGEEGWLNN